MKPKAKKALKITGITLGSLIGLVLILVLVVCWIVFSSSSLTKVAEKAIDKYELKESERFIKFSLEEMERENTTRLKHLKKA